LSSGLVLRQGRFDSEAALRSLITLKALTYAPTGGIVGAAHQTTTRFEDFWPD
jgi:hypothetical protein